MVYRIASSIFEFQNPISQVTQVSTPYQAFFVKKAFGDA